jgi:hypothetical protein
MDITLLYKMIFIFGEFNIFSILFIVVVVFVCFSRGVSIEEIIIIKKKEREKSRTRKKVEKTS